MKKILFFLSCALFQTRLPALASEFQKEQANFEIPSESAGIEKLDGSIDQYFLHFAENTAAFEVEYTEPPHWKSGGSSRSSRWTVSYGSHFTPKEIIATCHQVESLKNFDHLLVQVPVQPLPPVLPQKHVTFGSSLFDPKSTKVNLARTPQGFALYGLVQESRADGKILLISTENAINPSTLAKFSWEKHTEYKNFQEGNTRITIESIPGDAWRENRIEITPIDHQQMKIVLTRFEVFYNGGVLNSGFSKKEQSRYALHQWTFLCQEAKYIE